MSDEQNLKLECLRLADGNLGQAQDIFAWVSADGEPTQLEYKVYELWGILDDVDTADDIAKSNEALYRNLVRAHHKRRFDVVSGEEWDALRARICDTSEDDGLTRNHRPDETTTRTIAALSPTNAVEDTPPQSNAQEGGEEAAAQAADAEREYARNFALSEFMNLTGAQKHKQGDGSPDFAGDQWVEVLFRDGTTDEDQLRNYWWGVVGTADRDIIAYRIIETPSDPLQTTEAASEGLTSEQTNINQPHQTTDEAGQEESGGEAAQHLADDIPITVDPDLSEGERQAIIDGYRAAKRGDPRDSSHMQEDRRREWRWGYDVANDPTGIGPELNEPYGAPGDDPGAKVGEAVSEMDSQAEPQTAIEQTNIIYDQHHEATEPPPEASYAPVHEGREEDTGLAKVLGAGIARESIEREEREQAKSLLQRLFGAKETADA